MRALQSESGREAPYIIIRVGYELLRPRVQTDHIHTR